VNPELPICPADDRVPLYGPEFAMDPGRTYSRLRRYGPLAPVELSPGVPATLVVGYDAALEVLRDPVTFPKDPRPWEKRVPPDCPVLPMMMYRPNCMFTDGAYHARLRRAVTDSLGRVDPFALRSHVERSAKKLIDRFALSGQADLVGQYIKPLPLMIFCELFGCPPDIADRLVYGMNGIFDGIDAEKANAELTYGVLDLIAYKRRQPGADVTSWLLGHPARLTDEELAHQLIVLMGAGTQPEQNLIANALTLLLSDDRFAGDLAGGTLPVDDALDEVLWTDPPMANYAVTYPERDLIFTGVRLPAYQPVVISFAAANTDPSKFSDQRIGNRAHLTWGAGPHTCPAKGQARLIAMAAIEVLLDRLPDMELAIPTDRFDWRPGPFHHALMALPVRFPVLPPPDPTAPEDLRWSDSRISQPSPPSSTSPAAEPTPTKSGARRRWRNALARWWHG
jgi:cytochrome P450